MKEEINNSSHCGFAGSRVKKTLTLVLLMLAIFLVFKTVNTIKEYKYIGGGVSATNTISVSGKGEVFAVPDIAELSFSVVEESKTVPEAQEASAKKINSILKFLKDNGIEEKDIKTANYNIYPQYDYIRKNCLDGYCPPGEQVLRGFEVSQSISIKVRDTKESGKILSGIGERGATNISGLNFTIDDEEALITEARREAIINAQKKAKQLAKDLNVKLVRVVSFSEAENASYYPIYAYAKDATVEAQGGGISPEIPVGENKIISNISITYEIR